MLWSLTAEVEAATIQHRHGIIEFILCHRDAGQLHNARQSIELRRGRTLLVPPGQQHQLDACLESPARVTIFCLSPEELTTFLSPTQVLAINSLMARGVSYADHPAAALSGITAMIREGITPQDRATLHLNWALAGLLLTLHTTAHTIEEAPSLYHAKLTRILEWLEPRLQEPLGIDRVAGHFGMSRSLFSREFQRHTGKSFIAYCNARRLERAAMLLTTTPAGVTQVAFSCGFANLSHFHRQFKAAFGLTPGGFRRRMVEEGGR